MLTYTRLNQCFIGLTHLWYPRNKIEIGACLLKYIHYFFPGKQYNNSTQNHKYRNKHVLTQHTTKFLGLNLQYNLKLNIHRDVLPNHINKTLAIFKYLSGQWWGASIKELRLLYFALIQAKLDYTSFLMITYNQQ